LETVREQFSSMLSGFSEYAQKVNKHFNMNLLIWA
jgi:hypothetical protein